MLIAHWMRKVPKDFSLELKTHTSSCPTRDIQEVLKGTFAAIRGSRAN